MFVEVSITVCGTNSKLAATIKGNYYYVLMELISF